MKKLAVVMIMACIMGMAIFSVVNAAVTPPLYEVTISEIGAASWGYYFKCSDVGAAFTNVYFVIDPSNASKANGMYATGLTAFANSTNAQVYLPAITEWSTCWSVSGLK